MAEDLKQFLTKQLANNAISITENAKNTLIDYLGLMSKWNQVFNLTAITEPKAMVNLHLIDSLAVNPFLNGSRCLDVGTGAGLPGIPLAIINPERHFTLVDKNNKKIRFLTQAIAELNLKNVTATHLRVEDFASDVKFDTILSRAFGTLGLFVEQTEHLLAPKGRLLAMKGKYPQEELNSVPKHFIVQEVKRLTLKGMDIERHIVCLSARNKED